MRKRKRGSSKDPSSTVLGSPLTVPILISRHFLFPFPRQSLGNAL